MRCYLFDIDGTLADLTHRLHHIAGEFDAQGMTKPKNWDAFYDACVDDKPIEHMLKVAFFLGLDADIIFVSGRAERCREATMAWLKTNLPTFDWNATSERELYMRANGDHRPDDIVKGELLDKIIADGWRPIMAFDDRSRVVKMWRARGIPCAQVAEGEF